MDVRGVDGKVPAKALALRGESGAGDPGCTAEAQVVMLAVKEETVEDRGRDMMVVGYVE